MSVVPLEWTRMMGNLRVALTERDTLKAVTGPAHDDACRTILRQVKRSLRQQCRCHQSSPPPCKGDDDEPTLAFAPAQVNVRSLGHLLAVAVLGQRHLLLRIAKP